MGRCGRGGPGPGLWLDLAPGGLFGLWRIRFPPVLVRTGRRLPVQALGGPTLRRRCARRYFMCTKIVHSELKI